MRDNKSLNQVLMPLRLIYFALMSSLLMYGLVSAKVQGEVQALAEEMIITLQVCSFGLLVLGVLLFRKFFGKSKHTRTQSGEVQTLTTALRQQIFTKYIIVWAIFEGSAVMGLVLSVLSRDPNYYWTQGGLALLAFLAHPPTRGHISSSLKST